MFVMIDNYDSFTYNLVHYLEMLDVEVAVYRNDAIAIEGLAALNPKGIIISPGPCTPTESGISLKVIEKFQGIIPILGICLGHQTIAHYYGASVRKGAMPIHGKVYAIQHQGKGVFAGLPSPYNVTRYHSLVVDPSNLPECLEITASTLDGVVMGLRHKSYFIEGVQFHPEAILTQYGLELLTNFVRRCEAL